MPWVDYEEIVPCGAPDPTPDSASLNDTGFLIGGISTLCMSAWLDYRPALTATCGPVAEMATDDVGVCVIDEPAFTVAADAITASCDPELVTGEPIEVSAKGTMSYGSSVPADSTIVGVNAIFVGRIVGGGTFRLRTHRLDAVGAGVTSPVFTTRSNAGALERYEVALNSSSPETLTVRREAARNAWYMNELGTVGSDVFEVAFLGIKVTWSVFEEEVLTQPPQRIWPREDGLIGPGAKRNYPAPRSRQRSPRTSGGYL